MKIAFYLLRGKSEDWSRSAISLYSQKISGLLPFEIVEIKSKKSDRDDQAFKIKQEGEAILSTIKPNEFMILFDERGRKPKSSIEFSQNLVKIFETQNSKIAFVIGGPYGFSEDVKKRAQLTWCLSDLTMNHHVAAVVALKQIYRALTIWKGIPYHNP